VSLIFHDQDEAYTRRLEQLLGEYVRLTATNARAAEAYAAMTVHCAWCGAPAPAPIPFDGESLCAVCYPGGAA
jgi:hypothetical protein